MPLFDEMRGYYISGRVGRNVAEMSDMPTEIAELLASAISINSSYTTSVQVPVVIAAVVRRR